MTFWIPYFVGAGPFLILLGVIWLRAWKRRKESKAPFTSHLLRPPGESLRRKIEEIDERFYDQFIVMAISSVWMGVFCWLAFKDSVVWWIPVCLGLPGLAVFTIYAIRWNETFTLSWNYRLGYAGERAIGEELNQLLAHGWRVFHDVEFDENPSQKPFNIDHVVVGIGGVFTVETKTRRKPTKEAEMNVVYDGTMLKYPQGRDYSGVRQARANAVYLSKWLSKLLNETISTQAVLALPGWYVEAAEDDLKVVSGKAVSSLFDKERKFRRLEDKTVNAIVGLLDLKCRDVGKD